MLLLLLQEPDERTNDHDHQNYGAPEETILLLRSIDNIQEEVCKCRKQKLSLVIWWHTCFHLSSCLPHSSSAWRPGRSHHSLVWYKSKDAVQVELRLSPWSNHQHIEIRKTYIWFFHCSMPVCLDTQGPRWSFSCHTRCCLDFVLHQDIVDNEVWIVFQVSGDRIQWFNV